MDSAKLGRARKGLTIHIKKDKDIRLVTIFAFLVVVCLPFHTIEFGGVGLLLIIGLPLLILTVPAFVNCVKNTMWDIATIYLFLFFLYNILGYLWAPSVSLYSVYNYLKIIAITSCLYVQRYTQKEKKLLINGALLSAVIVCFFMLTEINIGYESGRPTIAVFGVVQDPNYIGYIFLIPLAMACRFFLNEQSKMKKIVSFCLMGVFLFCILKTGSRGAFLGCIIVVFLCLFTQFKGVWRKVRLTLIIGGSILLLYNFLLSLLPEYIANRFSIKLILQTGGTGRMAIWRRTLKIIKENPYRILFGFGTGSSAKIIGWATHNVILQLLFEGGIVSLALFLNFCITWLKRLARKDKANFAALMGCLAIAMTLSVNTIYYFWVTVILTIVCSDAIPSRDEDNV